MPTGYNAEKILIKCKRSDRCNKTFEVSNTRNGLKRKFCCLECKKAPLIKICIGCNKIFEVEYRKIGLERKYCTLECHFLHRIDSPISKTETLFFNKLEEIYNVKIKRQFYLEKRYFDGLVEGTNILIESDCNFWHKNRKENDELKNKIAKENGYQLYRFENNSVREVSKNIIKYKSKLDSIFL